MATSVLGLKTFAASDPVDYNEVNDNYNKIDNGVKTAMQGRAAHNLLDNSDFRNPVNQRSFTNGQTVPAWGMCIDRWQNQSSTDGAIYFETNGIKFKPYFNQILNPDTVKNGMVVTVACKWEDGTIQTATGTITRGTTWTWFSSSVQNGSVIGVVDNGKGLSYIRIDNDASKILVWAALYEGSYDASTLPAYQPKGYAAELAECQRYFERLGGTFSQFLGNAVFAKAGAKSVIISIKYSPKRLSNPTLSFSNPREYRMLQKDAVNASTISAYSITSFDNITTETPFAFFRVNLANALASDSWLILQRADGATGAYIDVNADM